MKLNITRKPTIEFQNKYFASDEKRKLSRVLGWHHIAVSAIALSVGAGIFSVGAEVISNQAGPAAVISFIIAGFICALAAMCYAEFASTMPIAGSSFAYTYATLGEIFGWFVGWNIILEIFLATAVVSKFWCIYLYDFFRFVGIEGIGPLLIGDFSLDWPLFILMAVFAIILIKGTKLAASITNIMVVLKISIILLVIIIGAKYFDINNFLPFIPQPHISGGHNMTTLNQSLFSWILGQEPASFGIFGIFSGAGVIFFAFIGFDAAAGLAEETKKPYRNVPIGLLVGIITVIILYIMVAVVTCAMVPYTAFGDYIANHPGSSASLTTAFAIVGDNTTGAIISLGIVVGLLSVILVAMNTCSRLVFALSRAGLMPRGLSITSKYNTPHRAIIIITIGATLVAIIANVGLIAEMISLGTLAAFLFVSISIPIYRKRTINDTNIKDNKHNGLINKNNESTEKPFRVPLNPVFPIITALACGWLLFQLSIITWIAYAIWVIAGMIIYFGFGYSHSMLSKNQEYIYQPND